MKSKRIYSNRKEESGPYDKYVNDKKLFRKRVRECKTPEELYNFLGEIAKGCVNYSCYYKLYCENKWQIPFEDIDIRKDGTITGYFYLNGTRTYKSILGFSKKVELIKYQGYERGYGVFLI